MSDCHIIPFAPHHAKEFEALNRAWLEQYFEVEPIDKEVLGDPQRHIIAPGGYIWLAQVTGRIVGTLALIRGGDTFEMSKMAVDPAFQGRGIARKLIGEALSFVASTGVPSIYLLTSAKLESANALYERMGFMKVEPTAEDRAHYARCDTRWEFYFTDNEANVG